MYKDYSIYATPNKHSGKPITSFGIETKINELECKIIALEEQNTLLLSRLNNNEQKYETKIRKLEKNNMEDKNNIFIAEQNLAFLTQKNNENSNDIKNKISLLHNNLQREEEYKNEQRKMDLELQQNILNKITEKLAETVKAEVDARFKADMETKAYNQNIYKNMENDMNRLKKEIESISTKVNGEIKIISKDCSERAHNISKYIDQQILNAVLGRNDTLDNIKKFVDQMIAQVKTNISSQNEQNRLFDQRLKNCEIHVEKSKNENFGYMSEAEKRFDNKMKNLKAYFEVNLRKHDIFINDNMINLAKTVDENINFLANQIIETRIKENEFYEKISKINDNKFKSVGNDLEKICERVYQYENLLNVFDKQNDLLKKNISDALSMVKSRLDVHLVNEKILYRIENNFIQEQITSLRKNFERSNLDLIDNLQKLDKGNQDSVATLLLKLNEQQRLFNNAEKVNKDRFKNLEDRTDENEVNQLMNEMMNNIENQSIVYHLEKSIKYENDLNKIVEKHQENINKLNNETETNKKSTDLLTEKMNLISDALNSSGANLSKAMDDIIRIQKEAKELEMKESVSKLMEVMLTNIENEIINEKMDDMNKFNLQQMTINITNLKNKINSLTETSKSNSTDIFNLKESVDMIKKRGLDYPGNHNNCSIKIAMNQMLNNVEFKNIYTLLKDGIKNSPIEFNEEMKTKYSELIDNKIKNELEKIKNDNQNMWINAVELTQKFNKPGEIKEIIDKIPPTILPIDDSIKRLLDVDYYNGKNSSPKVPDLDNKLKSMETEPDENAEKEKDNNLVQNELNPENSQDQAKLFVKPGAENENDKNSKGSKTSSKKEKNSKVSNNSKKQNTENDKKSNNRYENKSNNSGSKKSKGSQNIKEDKKSNSSKNKNEPNNNNESDKKNINTEGEQQHEDEEEKGEENV